MKLLWSIYWYWTSRRNCLIKSLYLNCTLDIKLSELKNFMINLLRLRKKNQKWFYGSSFSVFVPWQIRESAYSPNPGFGAMTHNLFDLRPPPQNNYSQFFIAAIKDCLEKVYLNPKKCYYLKLQRVYKSIRRQSVLWFRFIAECGEVV